MIKVRRRDDKIVASWRQILVAELLLAEPRGSEAMMLMGWGGKIFTPPLPGQDFVPINICESLGGKGEKVYICGVKGPLASLGTAPRATAPAVVAKHATNSVCSNRCEYC